MGERRKKENGGEEGKGKREEEEGKTSLPFHQLCWYTYTRLWRGEMEGETSYLVCWITGSFSTARMAS